MTVVSTESQKARLASFSAPVYAPCFQVRPGSVRDSVWRAESLAHELITEHSLDSKSTALVVGFGPVGIAISTVLASHGVNLVISDAAYRARDQPMFLCNKRMLCPTTFDFPVRQWPRRVYPFDGSDSLISWHADTPEGVHSQLLRCFNHVIQRANAGQVAVYEDCRITEFSADEKVISYSIVDDGPASTHGTEYKSCDIAFFCVGPGQHKCEFTGTSGQRYVSHGFWSNDTAPYSFAGKNSLGRVLIIGGQDGGLGEFTRVATGKSDPHALLKALRLGKHSLEHVTNLNEQMWDHWTTSDATRIDHEHRAFMNLQSRSVEFVNELWTNDSKLRSRTFGLLRRVRRRPVLQLAFRCCHFGLSYWANRLVVHLLARALSDNNFKENQGVPPLLFGVELDDVLGIDHACRGDRDECSQFYHQVKFRTSWCSGVPQTLEDVLSGCCYETRTDASRCVTASFSTKEVICDRLFLRFGSDPWRQSVPENVFVALQGLGTEFRHVPHFYRTGSATP